MCSIIAANHQKDLELVFFENRDRPKELFIGNDIRKIDGVVGIYDFRSKGVACGYSLESGTAGGVANILGHYGTKSRGVILLRALEEGRSAKDAARIIKTEVSSGDYGSAKYVLCDEKAIAIVESFGTEVKTFEDQTKFVVTTNHFRNIQLGKRFANSVLRERYMKTLGKSISEQSILKLATRHRNPAICRHGRTVSSFIVFKRRGEKEDLRIFYSLQEPCKGYKEF